MAKSKRVGRPRREGPPPKLQFTKAPQELARDVAAIAAMTGERVDEVWGRVASDAVAAELSRLTARDRKGA